MEEIEKKRDRLEALVHPLLEEECVCYIVIGCIRSEEAGSMQVSMQYEGDKDIVRYLLEQAPSFLESED